MEAATAETVRSHALTPMQRDIYLEQERCGDWPVASIGGAVRLGTDLNVDLWEEAVRTVVRQERILRSKVFSGDEGLMQETDAAAGTMLRRLAATGEEEFEACVAERIAKVREAARGDWFRHWLVPMPEGGWHAVVGLSHVFGDGHSLRLVFERIGRVYGSLYRGDVPEIPEDPDFYDFLEATPHGPASERVREFWRARLAEVRPLHFIARHEEGGGSCCDELMFSEGETRTLFEACERVGCSLPLLLQQAYALALDGMRLPEEGDWVMHVMHAGRPPKYARTIGCFAQADPYVVKAGDFAASRAVREVLLEPLARRKDAFRSGARPGSLSMLEQREMVPEGGIRVRFNFYEFTSVKLPGGEEELKVWTTQPEHEIQLTATIVRGCLRWRHLYHARRFGGRDFLPRLRHLVMQLIDPAKKTLEEIEGLLPEERRRLEVWNPAFRPFPASTLAEAFVAQAAWTPRRTAVVDGGEEWSYARLEAVSRCIASRLKGAGVKDGDRVAIFASRRAEMIAAVLGVLRSGAAYVPLDPEYPSSRLAWTMEDAGVALLLHHRHLAVPEHAESVRRLSIEEAREGEAEDGMPLSEGPAADDPAYLIYTSGSTGMPKGVVITHRNAMNFVHWAAALGGGEGGAVLASTSLCFDLSVFEIFAPLLHGGTVILAANALELPELEAAGRVRLLNTVPSAARELLLAGGLPGTLETVVLAGEKLDQALVEDLYRHGIRDVFDCYGPSETTTYSTWTRREPGGQATVGKPIANTRIYVVNVRGELAPPGAAGEIWIGGAGVAAGYRNRPDLNAERFLPDPFFPEGEFARVYRTGDLGRWNEEGDLEILGRLDQQIKIRGFRVEPGETESVLGNHPAVREVAVLALEAPRGGRRLVAFVAAEPEAGLEPDLRRQARARLPEAQCPSLYVFLDRLPRLPNGKLDVACLRRQPLQEARPADQSSRETATSKALAGIWREVLGVGRVSWDDHFFHIGGDSLSAMRVVGMAGRHFGKRLVLRDLFRHATLGEFAAHVDGVVSGEVISERTTAVKGLKFPLGTLQKAFWMLQEMAGGGAAWHITQVTAWKGRIDREALERSLACVVERHPMLRVRISDDGGEPCQQVVENAGVTLVVADFSTLDDGARERGVDGWLAEQQRRPFTLDCGPPCRFGLAKLGEGEHLFVSTFHHLAMDEWSLGVVIRDLGRAYTAHAGGRAPGFGPAPLLYEDFVRREAAFEATVWPRHLAYWRRRLEGVPSLRLPEATSREFHATGPGAMATLDVSAAVVERLRRLGREENATLFMTLQAAVQCLLHRWTDQDDFVIGSAMANRSMSGCEETVGLFVNMVPIRVRAVGRPSFRTLLRRSRAAVTQALAHQEVPHPVIAAALGQTSRAGTTPLFRVVFNHQDVDAAYVPLPGLASEARPAAQLDCAYDLSIYATELEGGLTLKLVHRLDVLRPAVIHRLRDALASLLEAASLSPDEPVSRLPLFPQALPSVSPAARLRPRPGLISFDVHALDGSVTDRFRKEAALHAGELAVADGVHRWSYEDLRLRMDRAAGVVARWRDARSPRIAVLCRHDAPMVAALLGVLAAGCVYVPLDQAHPPERWKRIIGDCEVGLILADASFAEAIRPLAEGICPVVTLDAEGSGADLAENTPGPDSRAYILYTSGSTGRPKGVVQNHRNLLHHIGVYTDQLCLDAADRIAMLASYGFDAAVMDMYGALLNGASLHLFDVRNRGLEALTDWLEKERITVFHGTPTLYRAWLAVLGERPAPASIRLVVLGGEEAWRSDFDAFRERFSRGCVLVNGLGPTESTLALQQFLDHDSEVEGDRLPVGWPVPGTEVLLLDDEGRETELSGEIALRGRHLALEYWRRPELTAEKFPAAGEDGGKRLYLTGDLGRRQPDGAFSYLGRKDRQVKVRGVRIELGEIESCLRLHENVREAVVRAEREPAGGGVTLDAYVVAARQPAPTANALHELLARHLPDAMWPRSYTILADLPRNANGKVDRDHLPLPQGAPASGRERHAPPATPVERSMVEIWQEVLGRESIGIHDHFFELGGHSLKALELLAKVNRFFGRQDSVRFLFEYPTCAQWAARIEQEAVSLPVRSGRDFRFLVPLREGGAACPLFVVPGGWGGENEMLVFAGLLPYTGLREAVYGFRSGILDPDYHPADSTSALAERYVADLLACHPQGDYRLAGECIGGLIVLEMARQLEALGRSPSQLILLDTRFPSADDRRNHRRRGFEELKRLHGKKRARPVFDYYASLYKEAPLAPDGRTVLLASRESRRQWGKALGWESCGGEFPETVEVPGDHDSYIREHRAETGRILGEILGRISSSAGP